MSQKSKSDEGTPISVEEVIGRPSRTKSSSNSESSYGKKSVKSDTKQKKSEKTNTKKSISNMKSVGKTSKLKKSSSKKQQDSNERKGKIRTDRNGSRKPNNFIPGMIASNKKGSNYKKNMDKFKSTPTKTVVGFLEIMNEGHGFLRPQFVPSDKDIYISQSQIRKFQLRPGDKVEGQARMPKENERYLGLLKVEKVNDIEADDSLNRPYFDELTPTYPNKQLILETEKTPLSTRIIDLLSPIGFGQRGLIVSPPKAGKTTILKDIAHGVTENFPKSHLMAVLIGERPEEVTDINQSVKGEVIASNFDESPEAQTKVAEVALDRAKRMVELKSDVVVLLDSITRLARAYNLCVNPSGRTLSGGFDPAALYPAKRFLGAARNCQEGGSLTIIGTALIETGSRMDDLIYEEFKGTGNMELHLSRFLQEQRVFPAIDIDKSGTRHEELLLDNDTLKKTVTLRHMMSLLGEGHERTQALITRLEKTKKNKEFLQSLNKG